MANENPLFRVLEDLDGAGVGLSSRENGDLRGSAKQAPVLPAVDPLGNMRNLELDDDNALKVSSDLGVPKDATNKITVAAKEVEEVVVTLPLQNNYKYRNIKWEGFISQFSSWRLAWNNNGVETDKAYGLSGSGSMRASGQIENINVDAGATGTQELKLYITQEDGKLSDAMGQITCRELAP